VLDRCGEPLAGDVFDALARPTDRGRMMATAELCHRHPRAAWRAIDDTLGAVHRYEALRRLAVIGLSRALEELPPAAALIESVRAERQRHARYSFMVRYAYEGPPRRAPRLRYT
jgi:hypothetical protein